MWFDVKPNPAEMEPGSSHQHSGTATPTAERISETRTAHGLSTPPITQHFSDWFHIEFDVISMWIRCENLSSLRSLSAIESHVFWNYSNPRKQETNQEKCCKGFSSHRFHIEFSISHRIFDVNRCDSMWSQIRQKWNQSSPTSTLGLSCQLPSG